MDSSVLRRHGSTLFAALIALTVGTGALEAAGAPALLLTATPTSATLTCNTATGTPTSTIVVTPKTALAGTNTLAVALTVSYTGSAAGVTVSPASGTLSATTTSLSFVVGLNSNCSGVTAGAATITFQQGISLTNDATVGLTIAPPVVTTSALNPASSVVNITCLGGTYYAQNLSVTSVIPGGTPFTVTTAGGGALPSWLATITGATAGVAGGTPGPASLTIQGQTSCTSQSVILHLVTTGSLGVPDKLVTVTETVVSASTLSWCLTANGCPTQGTTAAVTYVKGSGLPGKVIVTVTSTVPGFFSMDTTTLPVWLTADTTSGNLVTGSLSKNITFSSTSYADSLVPGIYSTAGSGIRFNVSGTAPTYIPLTLQVTNAAPKLTVALPQTQALTWVIGTPYPTPVITAVSSDTPIPFTVSTAGPLAPLVCINCSGSTVPTSTGSGLAYTFGTPINVTFNPSVFVSASPGAVLTGTVTLTSGTPSSNLVVTYNITVQSALATISSISPGSLPTASTATQFPGVILSGSGFIVSSNAQVKTTVGIVPSGSSAMVVDTNISWVVSDTAHINLTINANTTDTLLPWTNGGTVTIGVCNPACVGNIPTGTATLTIGSNPAVTAVVSSSTFAQPVTPSVAPYDMISIFGSNFCASGVSGCASNQILYGTADPVLLTYPTTLNVDATLLATPLPATTPCTGTQRCVSVSFYTHGSVPPAGIIASSPLLFATTGQINAVVPSIIGAPATQVDMYVNFGYGAAGSSTLHSSAPYTLTVVAKDPGIFTTTADGTGSGAILSPNYSLVTSANPAGMRTVSADSDYVQIYMTGLGLPDSANSGTGSYAWSADCESATGYLSLFEALTNQTLTTLDGAVITNNALSTVTGKLVPCFLAADPLTVTIGGRQASFTPAGSYAGMAPGTIAGLYQLNVYLPVSTSTLTTITNNVPALLTGPSQVPVTVTYTPVSGTPVSSQSGVYVWVTPKLKVVATGSANIPALSVNGYTGTVGSAFSQQITASESPTSATPYTYSITSGTLPAGLVMNSGGTPGLIAGIPLAGSAGTYPLTVTALDSANIPVSGSVSFTIYIPGGLFMSDSAAGPFNFIYGSSNASLSIVTATGGAYPYTYTITTPTTVPTGLAMTSAPGATGTLSYTSALKAGNYTVSVQALDSLGVTGTSVFTLNNALHLAYGVQATTTGNGGAATVATLQTITATGGAGTPTFAITSFTDGGGTVYSGGTLAAALATNGVSISSSGGVGTVSLNATPVGTMYSISITATDSTTPTADHSTAGTAVATPITFVVN